MSTLDQWVIEQLIRELAYSKWEQAGRPDEMSMTFWVEAEKEIVEGLQNSPKSDS